MLRPALIIITAFLTAACASKPDNMTSSYVSPLQYKNYDCDQLAAEGSTIERRVSELYAALDKKSSNDSIQMGVGLVLFWPTLFFLEGGDGAEAVEYKRLKGEYEAIQKTSIQKKCGLEFNIQRAIPQKPQPKKTDEVSKRMGN